MRRSHRDVAEWAPEFAASRSAVVICQKGLKLSQGVAAWLRHAGVPADSLEGGALGNEEYNAGRGGGFVRADLRAVEVTLSGGFTGNYLEDEPSATCRSASIAPSEID